MSIISKVFRDGRRHITRADYDDEPVLLTHKNLIFPRINSLEARALRRLLPAGRLMSHRDFDRKSHSYRLSGYIGFLRDKGWPIVNHDEIKETKDVVPRKALFTRYELFAVFDPELRNKITLFCKAVDRFETEAAATASVEA